MAKPKKAQNKAILEPKEVKKEKEYKKCVCGYDKAVVGGRCLICQRVIN